MASQNQPSIPAAPPAPPAASVPTPPTPAEALSNAAQVEQLADQLTACADSIHQRVMRDIKGHHGGAIPEAEQGAARALLEAEAELRQRANRLYTDAAACIVASLGQSQQHLMQLTAEAAEKITRITRIGDSITLVARLLGLATAASTGHALAVLGAIDRLKTQLDVIAVHNAPPAAPAATGTAA
jgi:hypothetical protein